jgi:hypothetical protein
MHFVELPVLTLRASRPLSLSMGLAKARLARTAEAIREKKRMMVIAVRLENEWIRSNDLGWFNE